MNYRSTRHRVSPAPFSAAMLGGLAPDGGLYVPERFARFERGSIGDEPDFAKIAGLVLRPYLDGDALAGELDEICRTAFDFPVPLEPLRDETAVLELYQGPTSAFKDFGARFLAECTTRRLQAGSPPPPLTVLVATSGDTGGAVAAAFHRRAGIRVAILYPRGGVSERQEQQLACWGDNVLTLAVRGTFDDCQRVVKSAFRDGRLATRHRLTSANSINIGRLLPQMAYYAAGSEGYLARTGHEAGFIVPTGNVGNVAAAFWARASGFPIREIVLATNANRVIPDWYDRSEWRPRRSVATLANAMDVGDPSNMERLFDLFPHGEGLRQISRAGSVDDDTIRRVIAAGPVSWGRVWCPHTATAVHLRETIGTPHWVVVATAHPAKFDTIVEPLIGRSVEPPPRLAELLERPRQVTEIEAELDALDRALS
ncbi:MAG TPA: threonine synthase [Candidatus Polarisedimenticolaceae bacterium]|nr:threonine synthase [Candidatus Polarisedimenticolaceae bacterium]